MNNSCRWLKNRWPLVAFAIYWVAHIYIWGLWGWGESELFNPNWWFDETGHAFFGTMMAFTLLYYYKTYSLYGIFRFTGKRHLIKDIVEDVAIYGILWELIELGWDRYLQPNYLDWLSKAQKGAADTVIDLVVNPLFAFIALVVYFFLMRLFRHIYEKTHPNDGNAVIVEEEVEEVLGMLHDLDKYIRFIRKERLKQLMPSLREFFRLLREDK